MRIQLLGGFSVDVGQRTVDPASWRLRKARTLVKLLALAPDQRMHREQLMDLLWPEREAASAANNLHQALHVARRTLSGDGDDAVLTMTDEVVVLRDEDPVDVDVTAFVALARQAEGSGDPDALRAADAAYTGDLLPEDRYEPWTEPVREQLRHRHRDLLVRLGEVLAEAGHREEAERTWERVLAAYPLHEPAVRGLMRALAVAGRRSVALIRYEQLRDGLHETYGTDPDPQTRALFRELLVGSATPAGGDAPDPRPGAGAPRHNLPAPVTSFVGRDRELGELYGLLGRTSLLTLTGPGGAGKTRLAVEAARGLLDRFPQGAWQVDLVPVRDGHLVADTVAVALGHDPSAGPDPLRSLVAHLASSRLLLLLDNCEHLLDASAAVAEAVRASCPGVVVLATSREPLHVEGEVLFRVPSLALPEVGDTPDPESSTSPASVRLFWDRARDVRPDLAFDTETADTVAEICRRLDGMPLALELAAARTAHLEPVEIAERLGDALAVLGARGRTTRHATLRAALEWSHGLLDTAEQVLLSRLSVFDGGCSLTAVEAVCADDHLSPDDVLDVLGRLVDKSLVQVDRSGGRSRYRLLETVRQFAAERLESAGATRRVRDAHATYYLGVASAYDPDRSTGVVVERPQMLDAEHDNLRGALAWGLAHDPARALRTAVGLWRFWLARGLYAEGADWLTRALAACPEPTRERADALIGLGLLEVRLGRVGRARGLAAEGADTAALLRGPEKDVVFARLYVGFFVFLSGGLSDAEAVAEDAFVAARRLRCRELGATARWLSGITAAMREDADGVEATLADCLDRLAGVDQSLPPFFPGATVCMSPAACAPGSPPVFEETGLLGRRVGASQAAGYVHNTLASARRAARRPADALGPVQAAVTTFGSLGDLNGLALALNHLGCLARDLGDPAATEHLAEALRLRERIGDRRGAVLTLANTGLAAAATGDPATGRAYVRSALVRAESADDGPASAGLVLDLAVVELMAGEHQVARALAEQAAEAFRPQGYRSLDALVRLFAADLASVEPAGEGERTRARAYAEEAGSLFAELRCVPGEARVQAVLDRLAPPHPRAKRR